MVGPSDSESTCVGLPLPNGRLVVFVATDMAQVPSGCRRYASVDGSVPGAAVTWDHHVTGEPINLDAMPDEVDARDLDGVGTTLPDTDALASVAAVLLGGKAHLAPDLRATLESASHWCDHLAAHPRLPDDANERGRAFSDWVSSELARVAQSERSGRFVAMCRDVAQRIAVGEPLPETAVADDRHARACALDAAGRIERRGYVAVFDLRGRPPLPPDALYALVDEPVGVFLEDHLNGGVKYTVGRNPRVPTAPEDLGPALRSLARAEYGHGPPALAPDPIPGAETWGGRKTVFGSPWNYGSRLGTDDVARIVEKALRTTWLLNAFSLNMLGDAPDATIHVRALDLDEARSLAAGAVSAVGHAETAAVFGSVLGREVARARDTVVLRPGDHAVVGQYVGPRLPEGATALPEGATIRWFAVEWKSPSR